MDLYQSNNLPSCLIQLSKLANSSTHSKSRVAANVALVTFLLNRSRAITNNNKQAEDEALSTYREYLENSIQTFGILQQQQQQQSTIQQQQQSSATKKKPEKKPTNSTPPSSSTYLLASEFASIHFNLALISDPSERWRLLKPLLLGSESLTPHMQRLVCCLILHDFTRNSLKLYGPCPARDHASRVVRRALSCLTSAAAAVAINNTKEQTEYWSRVISTFTLRASTLFEDVIPTPTDAELLTNINTVVNNVNNTDFLTINTCLLFLNLEMASKGTRDEASVVEKLSCIVSGKPLPNTNTTITNNNAIICALNNLACIHFRHGRKALSLSCLATALKKIHEITPTSIIPSTNPTIPNMALNLIEIGTLYVNSGRCLLKFGKYQEAFEMFEIAASIEQASPLIWLRMAECASRLCIESPPGWPIPAEENSAMILTPNGKINMKWLSKGLEALDTCLACLQSDDLKQHEPPLSPTRVIPRKTVATQTTASTNIDDEEDTQALLEAAQAANNNNSNNKYSSNNNKTGGATHNNSSTTTNKNKTSGGIQQQLQQQQQQQQQDQVKVAALLLKAYLYTLQENPSAALGAARAVLQLSATTIGMSNLHIAKACTYASEALARTGRLEESLSLALRAVALTKDDKLSTSPKELAALRVNLAAVLCARGKLAEAERELHGALVLDPISPMVFRNLLWVYLRTHRSAAAAQVVQTRRASPLIT
jgi:tetratricopeptide (TPR) repeat protein